MDIKANSRISTTTPVITSLPLPTTTPLSYEQLREAAVKAELNAQKSQLLANQATAAFEASAAIFISAVKQAGFSDLFNLPASTPKTADKAGFYEVSKLAVAKKGKTQVGKVVDKYNAGVTDESMDVRPCNQILGIILPKWAGQPFKTSDGKAFNSYNAARDDVLKKDFLKNPIKVGTTGKVSQEGISDPYTKCLNIEDMSAQLGIPKKFADKIALDGADIWEPQLQKYYTAVQNYQDAVQDWLAYETHLSDLCANMILVAEAKDSKLEGVAIDAYGFWLATKLRYYYMFNSTKPMLPSEKSLFVDLKVQKIFQDWSKGSIDTSAYRAALTEMLTSAAGPSALRRLDTAFGFAAANAASLKTETTLTKRVAKATIAKAAADKAAAAKSGPSASIATGPLNYGTTGLTGGAITNTSIAANNTVANKVPTRTTNPVMVNVTVTSDPEMAALSDRLLEAYYVLAVPVLDRTKKHGFTPTWVFITDFAYDMDKYFFALKDKSKSFAFKNGGFDIYDSVAGWHKMQVDWHLPYGFKVRSQRDYYPYGYEFFYSYTSDHPLYEVLSQSARAQDYWMTKKVDVRSNVAISLSQTKLQVEFSQYPALDVTPKYLLGITNAFGVSAATMLSAHSDATLTIDRLGFTDSRGSDIKVIQKDFLNVEVWKQEIKYFFSYLEKGLKANKDQGNPNVVAAKEIKSFSSVAALFHPISVGFGNCSIYQTLFSPYHERLGYACGDYAAPLLELLRPVNPTTKTSAIFRVLRRMNRWFEDQIIPSALAQEAGIDTFEIIPDPPPPIMEYEGPPMEILIEIVPWYAPL